MRVSQLAATALLSLFVAALGRTAAAQVPDARRPNVLLIVSDDQRADTVAALSGADVLTPNLDRLAREGCSFERAYAMGSMSGAVCAPSRAMLHSGRQLFRFESRHPSPSADLPSLGASLGGAGYATFMSGKWHNGKPWFQAAFQSGRAVFFGGMGSHTELRVFDRTEEGRYPQESSYRIRAFSSTAFADEVLAFLGEERGARPFFAYLSFTAPHDPRTPPAESREPYDPASIALPPNFLPLHPYDNGEMLVRDERLAPWPRTPEVVREHLADYHGMISQLDAQVGRVLAALDASGQADNTIVVFTSDHGLAVGSHGLMGKQNLYEHSTRVPLLFRGPGIPAGARSLAPAYLFDLFPTLCELTGVPPPAGLDGVSLAPFLQGRPAPQRTHVVTAYKDQQRALREDRWKLIRYPGIDRTQLFDLESDPHETRDLAADPEQAPRVERLLATLAERLAALGDDAPLSVADPRPAAFVPPR